MGILENIDATIDSYGKSAGTQDIAGLRVLQTRLSVLSSSLGSMVGVCYEQMEHARVERMQKGSKGDKYYVNEAQTKADYKMLELKRTQVNHILNAMTVCINSLSKEYTRSYNQ